MTAKTLSLERLRQVLAYDPDNGQFTWRIRMSARGMLGEIAGSVRKDGYRLIRIDGDRFYAHRLAWMHVHGEMPDYVDHINGATSDNRISNLRSVTNSVNGQNQRRPKSNNITGFLGVSRNGNGFDARIHIQGKTKCLGTYRTPEEAHAAYITAKRELHEGCTL